jgi:hypothetical protein
MKHSISVCCIFLSFFLFTGCPTDSDNGDPSTTTSTNESTSTTSSSGSTTTTTTNGSTTTTTNGSTSTTTSTEEEEYSVTIHVDNQDSDEYRFYIGTSDDLYDADTDLFDLDEGEIVISSIPPGETEMYELDLGTSPTGDKDWLVQYYDTFFGAWSTVVATPHTDSDAYTFEGDESYTITIDASGVVSIQQDD